VCVHPHQHVLQDGQRAEQADVLIGAGDAALRDLVGAQPGDGTAIKNDIALIRAVETGYAVEERGFSGTVRADQADDLAIVDLQIHMGNRYQPAETCFVIDCTSRRTSAMTCTFFQLQIFDVFAQARRRWRQQPLWPDKHHRDQQRSKGQQPVSIQFTQQLG
jgi:hypothetical protein